MIKKIYSKKLAKLQAQQDELRKTLEQLAIMQKQEDEAARAAREKQERAASKGGKRAKRASQWAEAIRQAQLRDTQAQGRSLRLIATL